jgi:7-cyano-7-deazaguanine reductase
VLSAFSASAVRRAFGVLEIRYMPTKLCQLKSLKEYLLHLSQPRHLSGKHREPGLEGVVRACKPKWAVVKGAVRPRGGIGTTVEARWPRPKK